MYVCASDFTKCIPIYLPFLNKILWLKKIGYTSVSSLSFENESHLSLSFEIVSKARVLVHEFC